MIRRCDNPAAAGYKRYGGRGITVCDRWHDVRLFIADVEAEIGPRPPGLTLERIDNDDGYGPGKVCWATRWEQAHNTRKQVRGPFSVVPPRRPSDDRWLPVPGYQGWYEVSSSGMVYSLPRSKTRGGLLRIQHSTGGTPVVRLSKYGRVRTVTVASLVRRAFG